MGAGSSSDTTCFTSCISTSPCDSERLEAQLEPAGLRGLSSPWSIERPDHSGLLLLPIARCCDENDSMLRPVPSSSVADMYLPLRFLTFL